MEESLISSKEEIKMLAEKATCFVSTGNIDEAFKKLKPLLDKKCSFSKLDFLGREIGKTGVGRPQELFRFFDLIVDYNAMGGFVIVGQALIPFLEKEFEQVMRKSCEYIIKGDEWYVCDIIGERSLGYALVDYFDRVLPWFETFLKVENNWVREVWE